MKISRIITLASLPAILLLAAYFYVQAMRAVRMVDATEFCMGTVVRIKVPLVSGMDETDIRRAMDMAFEEIARAESVFSIFREDSEISAINRLGPGEKLNISREVYDLIEKSVEYSKKTQGAFDITVKPLVDLWGRAKADRKLPSDDEVKTALLRVGYQYVELDRPGLSISFLRPGMALDMGGVAKGYAVDMAVKSLRESGVGNGIVSAGGDMYCLGRRSEQRPWRVGIRHPRDKGAIFKEVNVCDEAIDTSGDYEKYFILDGRRYSHIIDPRTGYPVGGDVASATVIAKDSATADILATSLCVLGRGGLDIAGSVEGVHAMIIMEKNGILKDEATDGFKKN